MAKACITGGTGFIGSHVARALVAEGHSVRVLHRPHSKLSALEGVSFESALGELYDIESLRAAFDGMDWVFHVAAVADYWRADVGTMFAVNVEGTRRVLLAAQQTGVRRVIFTSSAAAVGLRKDHPADESDPFNLPPKHFPYGHSKWLAEGVVHEAVLAGMDVVTVNPSVVMGPGDLNMISGSFIAQIKRFGAFAPVTDGGIAVTDVRDVARWHVRAAEVGESGERYILSTTNYPYRDWFNMIAEAIGGARPRVRVPNFVAPVVANVIDVARRLKLPTVIDASQARLGARNVYYDASKAWEAFGAPEIDMMQSLKDTCAWYRAHGVL